MQPMPTAVGIYGNQADKGAPTMINFDNTNTADAYAHKVNGSVSPLKPAKPQAAREAVETGSRLIMLRRDPKTPREGGTGRWLMRILGVEGFRKDEVPLPVAREAPLRDVLAHLASEHQEQLKDCWLLVAP